MSSIKISDLTKTIGLAPVLKKDALVQGLSYDSRKVKKGDIFFAIEGVHADGHDFLADVEKRGAIGAVVEKKVSSALPVIEVPSVLSAMSKMAKAFFNDPSSHMPVIGVTGTNGKTTTTYLIEDIFSSHGDTCAVMGTVNYRIGKEEWPAPNTTPMSLDVQEFINIALQKKATAVAMEVSSHALELKRVDDIHFSIRVFTNLTQDHLDFHKTMENYYLAKAKLFKRPENGRAVINIDDSYGKRLALEIPAAITYGLVADARLRAEDPRCDLEGVQFKLNFPSMKSFLVRTNLLGYHNVYNCLSAAGALLAYGMSEEEIVAGLARKHAVPGRLERVEQGQKFVVAIDYAHTDDALAQVLKTLRDTQPRRLVCVFGAGGDRDKTKRPKMGSVAVTLADYVYVTSDNPRTEKPADILKDIEEGIKKTNKNNYVLIEDREEAIHQAIHNSKEGDIVLIAGKGHETYQIIGNTKKHFSDFEVAQKALGQWN